MDHRKVTTRIAKYDSPLCLDDAESDRAHLNPSFIDHNLESIYDVLIVWFELDLYF